MKKIKFLLPVIFLLFLPFSLSGAQDDELYAAMYVDNLLFEMYESGLVGNIETLAKTAKLDVLERAAKGASKVKDSAEMALRIIKAYQEGARGGDLVAVVSKEVGKLGYKKLRKTAGDYIKSKVTSWNKLEEAYDLFGALHKSSYYIAYAGMTIGLDMMSEESIARLERSGFHKSAVWVTETTQRILQMADEGAADLTERFLKLTEGTMLDRASSAAIEKLSTIWDMAVEGAKDIWSLVGWGDDDDDDQGTPSGDSVIDSDDSDSQGPATGDQVIGPGDDSENSEPSSSYTEGGWGDFFAGGDLPSLGEIIEKTAEESSIVLPNIPHYRVLWMFSGENWADMLLELGGSIKDIFENGSFADIKETLEKEMGFKDMKDAFGSLGG